MSITEETKRLICENNVPQKRISNDDDNLDNSHNISQDLIAERRPRKSSIEMIKEEREDLTDQNFNNQNMQNSEKPKEINSENNENYEAESDLRA